MKTEYICSCSFGKDSLAMLLLLLEKKQPLDEVVFFNTGMEFQAIYDTRDKILPLLEENNVKYTELQMSKPFEWFMFDKEVNGRNGKHYGYSWCGGRCRWGTTEKTRIINEYLKGKNFYQYVGIASDETERIEKNTNNNKILPLVEWGMTEKQCLKYCYSKGFEWLEDGVPLYSFLDRVSCYCCKNKNLKELRYYYHNLPKYWEKLKELQSKTDRAFRTDGNSIFDLEKRFKFEDERLAQNKSITNREFFNELKEVLNN